MTEQKELTVDGVFSRYVGSFTHGALMSLDYVKQSVIYEMSKEVVCLDSIIYPFDERNDYEHFFSKKTGERYMIAEFVTSLKKYVEEHRQKK
jgi:hypothetical protein